VSKIGKKPADEPAADLQRKMRANHNIRYLG
jgi:hypothetical protein